ncbi:OmpA family protein [Metabacillus herbersteinensis]|uniref:OmpA family protein n=1 Tax=Metabacillus herbersteinensis TaxID=283816 RepID=A0ABV6GCU8_9BACI
MRSYPPILLASFILVALTACNTGLTQETSNHPQEEAVIDEEESGLASEDTLTDNDSTSISFEHGAINVTEEEDKTTISILDGLIFNYNESDLTEDALIHIEEVEKQLSKLKDVKVSIEGHTDNQAEPEFNLKLSKERAKVVYEVFEKRGILAHLEIVAEGYGDTMPTVPNSNLENQQFNRRIDIVVD